MKGESHFTLINPHISVNRLKKINFKKSLPKDEIPKMSTIFKSDMHKK